MGVAKKRWMKLTGWLNYVSSILLLRYTKFNASLLAKSIASAGVEKLHVGCGHVLLPGWLNILFEKRQEYGRVKNINGALLLNYNLLKPWPVEDDSISFIAGSHFIEHLDLNAGMKFVTYAHRVMKKGGVIRLSCPDLEVYAKNYVAGNRPFFDHPLIREWCTFKAATTPGEIFIAKAYDSGGAHKWFYDFASLKHILESAGFSDVRRVSRLEGKSPDLEKLEPPQRELETVYVEAAKL
jgi:predicted SAM-dependent methyltransferase